MTSVVENQSPSGESNAALLEKLDTLTATIAGLQATITHLVQQLERRDEELKRRDEQNQALRQALFGTKSERMPELGAERRRRAKANQDGPTLAEKKATQEKRESRRDKRSELPEILTESVADSCTSCGGTSLVDLNTSEDSTVYEYVPARLVRRRHRRHKSRCVDCNTVTTAPNIANVVDGGHYGPGLYAHAITAKCADSIPHYRLAKSFERAGVPMSRSTLTDLFHRSAELLSPLAKRILELVGQSSKVNADETPIAVQARKKCRKGYVWTFLSAEDKLVGFVFSAGRSGEVPARILGQTSGTLQTDAYSGYNTVLIPSGRQRVSCLAHIRRYFFNALGTSPEVATESMEVIRSLYEIEYRAAEERVLGTARHLAMRKTLTREYLDTLKELVTREKPKHAPKSPIGKALGYAENNLPLLDPVCEDASLRLDNNLAENALRTIALGRKNFLFVGSNEAGENFATLQTLVSTCIVNDVNPQDYLADVLMRIQDTPSSRLDELLPGKWARLDR